jgi:hypothetical protein
MSYINTFGLEEMSPKSRLKELYIRKRDAIRGVELQHTQLEINTFKELEAESRNKNPNYIKHSIKVDEVHVLLTRILDELSLLTSENYRAVSVKGTVNKIWQEIAMNKHQDWLQKIKHMNAGYLFKQTITIGFELQLPPNLTATYAKLDPSRLNFNKTLNVITKQIYNEIWEAMEKEFLIEEIELFKQRYIDAKARISMLERDLEAGRFIPSKADWTDKAIEMRRNGYSVKDICFDVGKARTAVSKALNSEKAKALLM